MLIHLDDLSPVSRDLGQVQALAQIDQVEDIFLEARSTKANTGLEKFRPDAGVVPNSVGNFVNVRPSGFANGGKGIDGGDALGQHCIRGELRKLRRPEADGEDLVLAKHRKFNQGKTGKHLTRYSRDPIGINFLEALAGVETLRCLQGPNQHTIGGKKVRDGRPLREKFGVGEDIKSAVGLRVGLENGAH